MAAVAALACLGTAACGDDDDGSPGATNPPATTATAPQATAPSATEPPPDATGPAPPGGAEHGAREDENREEEPVRVDADFTLRGGRLRPATVTTPAFLAVSVSVLNRDAVSRMIVVRADRDYRIPVGPGRRAVRQIPGQRAGTYPVLVDGRRRGALVFGGEPGP